MKKYLLIACMAFATLTAEEQFYPGINTDLHDLYTKNYLNAKDQDDVKFILASHVITETESLLTPSQLLEMYNEIAGSPEIEEKYVSIIAESFNVEEAKQACELLNNELYMKLRRQIELANYQLHVETFNILTDLAQKEKENPRKLPPEADKFDIIQMDKNNFEKVLNAGRPVVIDVYTDWCGPCKNFAHVFKEVNEEYGHLYQFAKLNAEEQESLAKRLKIEAYPTIIFFKDGKEVRREKGYLNKQKFISKLQKYFD